jgi:hypothetical protein
MPTAALALVISALGSGTGVVSAVMAWTAARRARPSVVTLHVGDKAVTVDSNLSESELEKAVRGLLEAGSAREPVSTDE